MKKNKGFTLIELLAVIVVLAIIALISAPTILGVIEKAKKGAAQSSTLGYIDAVEKQIAINVLDNSKRNIVDGVYETDILNSDMYGIKIKGNKPEATSWVRLEKNQVVDYSLKIGNYIVSYNTETKTADAVKGDTVNTKPPVPFSTDSWATIAANVKSGNYPYQVGDEKVITLAAHTNDCASYSGSGATYQCNSEEVAEKEVKVRVANISPCINGETSETACGFVVEFVDIIEKHNYNNADSTNAYGTNVGGWPASKLSTYINSTIYNALPSDLQSVIADTTVVSSHGSTSGEGNFTSIDKLYLLSTKEVWNGGTGKDTAESETRQLDYYANLGVTTSNYSGTIKQNSGTNNYWWLRPARSNNTFDFFVVDPSGGWSTVYANRTHGVSPAFRIG